MNFRVIAMSLAIFGLVGPLSATDYSNLLFFGGVGTTFVASGEKVTIKVPDAPSSSGWSVRTVEVNGYTNDYPLQDQINIIHKKDTTPRKVLVGHSQGGVKALGYAATYPEDTAAVITIGSPVKGYPLLANPRTTLTKLDDAVKTLSLGLASIVPVYGEASLNIWSWFKPERTVTQKLIGAVGLDSISDLSMRSMVALAYAPSGVNAPGMRDLAPNSDFMLNRVVPTTRVVNRTVKVVDRVDTKDVPVGRHWVPFLWMGWWVTDYQRVSTTIYREYQVYDHTDYFSKISKSTYIEFLRGQKNDPVSMADPVGQAQSRAVIKQFTDLMTTASSINKVGSLINFAAIPVAAVFQPWLVPGFMFSFVALARASNQGADGANWLRNYPTKVGEIMGDTANDSFIPDNAQFWDLNLYGGQPIIGGNQIIYTDPVNKISVNHFEEMNDPIIWGSGGGLEATTDPTGQARRFGVVGPDQNSYLHILLAELQRRDSTLLPKAQQEDGKFVATKSTHQW